MIQRWYIHYRKPAAIPTETIVTVSGRDLTTEKLALAAFHREHKDVTAKQICGTTRRLPACETYEELVAWLQAENVTPEKAQGCVCCLVINTRPENQRPNPCPYCGADLNKVGTDYVDNAYFCSRCKEVIQVG